MKYAIVTQIRNQENRIYDWLKYHSSQGFDTFIIFDDFSDDSTESEIRRAESELFINVILEKSDNIGGQYKADDSQSYAWDSSLHERLCRSYDRGIKIATSLNKDSICAVIDVDEFLVSDSNEKVTTIIQNIFDYNKCSQILVFNFDIRHDYKLEKGFLYKNKFERWNYDDVNNDDIWKNRCKSIVISSHVSSVNFVHLIINPPSSETFSNRDYSLLRMLHFRIPNQPNTSNIKFVKDKKLCNIFKNEI
jgi:hypothetical protein